MDKALSIAKTLQITRDRPVSLVHFVTDRCNARCPFCFIDFDDPEHGARELSLEEIGALARSLRGSPLYNINLTGGEPFLRPDLTDIAALWLGVAQAQSLFITTNGSLTGEVLAFAKGLSASFPDRPIAISISLDAPPEAHGRIRRLPGLGEAALETYHALERLGGNILPNIGITVSPANAKGVMALFEWLVGSAGVASITATLVRGAGVYALPEDQRRGVGDAYRALTQAIATDARLRGYQPSTIHGRLMNSKNAILHSILGEQIRQPHYVSPCHAGALFGVIGSQGEVYPCEVLDRPLGNLRDVDFDLLALWRAAAAKDARRFIKESKCHCTYECAWTFNILGNKRYAPKLALGALPFKRGSA